MEHPQNLGWLAVFRRRRKNSALYHASLRETVSSHQPDRGDFLSRAPVFHDSS